MRRNKVIGSSLDAEVDIYCKDEDYQNLLGLKDELRLSLSLLKQGSMNYRANHQAQKRLIALSQLKCAKVNIKSVFAVGIIAQKLAKTKYIMIYVIDVLRMSQVRAKIGCLLNDSSFKNSQC